MSRIWKKRVYLHPDAPRHFLSEHDARGWCTDHGADPTFIVGFDSTAEWNRWKQLKEMEAKGEITELHRQVPFTLIPKQVHKEKIGEKLVTTWFACGLPFTRKSDAVEYCREVKVPTSSVIKVVAPVNRYKEVVDEKPVHYVADFTYRLKNGEEVVEDCKSEYTRREKDYIIKRKLMLYVHSIKIYEYISDKKK